MKHVVLGKTSCSKIQFFRYLFVGGSASIVDLSTFYVVSELFGVHYLLGNVFSFIAGFTWNYTTSILWVFHDRKHDRHKEVLLTFIISIAGLMWLQLIMYLQIEFLGIHQLIAKVIGTGVVLFWNFGMRKRFVFH